MRTRHYSTRTILPVRPAEAMAWHERPGAFERLAPPWEPLEVLERRGTVRDGDSLTLQMRMGPLPVRWEAVHYGYREGEQFCDRQINGPFAHWEHAHRFAPHGATACRLTEEIDYRLPFEPLGGWLGDGQVRRKLEQMFAYRHRVTRLDLAAHARYRYKPRLKVAVSGASGLIGSALCHFLTTGGHSVVPIRRTPLGGSMSDVYWDPARGVRNPDALRGVDAVVHLAGENVGNGRWTRDKMERIRASRIEGTRSLVRSLCALDRPPRTLIAASAIGLYGDRGEEGLTETSRAGEGFLAELVQAWEAETEPAADRGIRTVGARFGPVLSPRGGALAMMLPAWKLGLGGPVGTGAQYSSWIGLDDAVGAVHHLLMNEELSGPFNITAPRPLTNAEVAGTLARVLGRPAPFALPERAVRLLLGRMGEDLLLPSVRALPAALTAAGYRFRDTDLESALGWMLGRPPKGRALACMHGAEQG
jgi:uncharacterized protein (TIGR01777 family)